MTIQQLENEAMNLSPVERIRLAKRLLMSVDVSDEQTEINPLLAVAGILSGGPGDLSERVNEVVSEEIAKKHAQAN